MVKFTKFKLSSTRFKNLGFFFYIQLPFLDLSLIHVDFVFVITLWLDTHTCLFLNKIHMK